MNKQIAGKHECLWQKDDCPFLSSCYYLETHFEFECTLFVIGLNNKPVSRPDFCKKKYPNGVFITGEKK